MKKNLFRFPSKRILFSTMMTSALIAASPLTAFADVTEVETVMQSAVIRGRIVDVNGEPVIGANVMLKGSTNGTITDVDGNFVLNNVVTGQKLTISFIGYQTQEVVIKNIGKLEIILVEDTAVLDEVVVVGYGSMKKETLSGSIAVVDNKIFQDRGTTANPLKALQGQVPGTRITRSSSAPGEEGWNISVRGAVSKNSTGPLVIIDGMPTEGTSALSSLNTSDIESMSFLKDASAAIYGAKAAGGVILVTTKRATAGKVRIEYNGSYTRKIVGLQAHLLSYDEWCDGTMQVVMNDNLGEDYVWYRYAKLAKAMKGGYLDLENGKNPSEPIPGAFAGVSDLVFQDVDWEDVLWKNANSTQHDLSFSGGNDKATYRLSIGYLNDQSTLRYGNNSNERYNVRLTNSFDINKRMNIASVISATRRDQVAPTRIGSMLSSTPLHPGFPIATIDGKPYNWGDEYGPNWLGELGGDNRLVVTTFSLNETFKYKILEGLNLTASFAYATDNASRDEKYLAINWYTYNGTPRRADKNPNPKQSETSYTKSTARTDTYSAVAYLTYTKKFADSHSLNVMLGTQYERMSYELTGMKAKDIQSSLEVLNGNGTTNISDAKKYEEAVLSYYSRLNYNYKEKYLLEVNARYDGSSKFQPHNRWDFFYGLSGGWRMTEEPFLANIKSVFDELKLKLSYGQVGNQSGIDRYDGIQFYSFKSKGGAFVDGDFLSYISAGSIVSQDRHWERIHNYNIGLDFAVLNRRLSGSVDLFMKRNNNMLVSKVYSGILGATAPALNDGKFESKGYEGSINWQDKIGEVSYHAGGTFTYMTNKLKSGGTDMISAGYNEAVNGYPLNSVFGYRYVGKIQNETQLKKYTDRYLASNTIGMPSNLRLGDHMYEDINKDGKLTQDDMIYLGTDDPKVSYSFNLGLEWRGIDFSATFQGVAKRTICRPADSYKVPFSSIYRNTSNASVGKVWSPETPDNHYPTYTNQKIINSYNYIVSSWYVEDGAYIRLKDIVLGYTLPQSFYKKLNHVISKLRVYVTGADLWEHSKINDGWDPEASRKVEKLERYPFNRTFTVGLNATF